MFEKARHLPVGTWYSRPCQGQATISRRDHVHEVGHNRERVAADVPAELRLEDVEVEGEDGVDDGDAVQQDRQVHFLGSLVYRVVLPVPPERLEARAREVDPDYLGLTGVAPDLPRRILGILGTRDDASEKAHLLRAPLVE